jgi:Acyclic terpene utilisation family protein AtuA
MASETLAIGCAAGFGGDRTDAAGPIVDTLIARGGAGVLVFEMLAERTLALAQLERRENPERGYAPLLEPMVRPILRRCLEHGIPIVSNFGAANPAAAARLIRQIAEQENVPRPRVAIVEGDDLSDARCRALLENLLKPTDTFREMVSANVYQGAAAIAEALRAGAHVVVTGRVADPSLVVGPALAHFNWGESDWHLLACATIAGHLIECGAQVSGGYFADPGFKDVPDLHAVGFPIVEIAADGKLVIGKADATGGLVDCRTVKEQLLYEIHDPAAYLTPDVVADISEAEVIEIGQNRVAISGIRGHPRPETLKTIVCLAGGWLGEGEISYAGPNAEGRARLAAEIIRRRVGEGLSLRCDLIGVLSVFADDGGRALCRRPSGDALDVRLRVAGTHADRTRVENLLREVTALYTCGPAGGGGVRTALTPRLNSASYLVPRDLVSVTFTFLE